MKSSVERLEGNLVKVEVEVPEEEVSKAISDTYRRIARQVSIPGFRRGHVPRQILDIRVGKQAIYQEAAQALISRSYEKAISDNRLRPIDSPKIEPPDVEEGKPLRYVAMVQVVPEVDLGDYRSVRVEKVSPPEVTEEDVESTIKTLREQMARFERADHSVAADGDYAVVDLTAHVDDAPAEDLSRKNLLVQVGESGALIGVEAEIAGMSIGETKEVLVDGSRTGIPRYEGKQVKYLVELKEIRRKVLPDLDEKFAKEISGSESVDELKKEIRSKLERAARERYRNEIESLVVKQVVDKASVTVPEVLVERRIDAMVEEMRRSVERQGMTLEGYLEATSTDLASLRSRFKEAAAEEVKTDLVLDAVAEAEGIEATNGEVEHRLEELAGASGKNVDEMRAILGDAGLGSIRRSIVRRKTLARLVELSGAEGAPTS
ncbi:MAG TPA: trigger factor [Firmicutes bacterium]|nr:trigger factor [Bacillota bacterium]